ncbi:MAG: cell division protein FtsK [Parcubacteria group bacterium]|nr:cell division protein FtsK [Parcubacteria group bacterium]MBI2049230.1 cell division protein FtsK [Parcubacteria group bacterium]
MGRRKKKDIEEEALETPSIGEEARRWIFALTSFAGMVFFVLASFNKAGLVGKTIFSFFSSFFGFGYYLFPVTLLLIGATLLRGNKRTFLFTSSGLMLFFFSGLAGIELVANDGGIAGKMIVGPLVAFFDIYASFVILGTLFLVSLLLITNTAPSFAWVSNIFRKRAESEEAPDVRVKESSAEEKTSIVDEAKDATTEEPVKKIFGIPVGSDLRKGAPAPQDAYARFALRYQNPPLELLQGDRGKPGVGDIKANANIIKRTLQNFGIDVEMDEVSVGPSVTRYALKPAQGVKLARIVGLKNDLSLALAAHPLRIEAPIPGKSLVGIELPNTSRTTVGLASLLSQDDYTASEKPLLVALGRGVTGKPHFGDLAKMPHLLIAGATGSGKSVAIHTIVVSLLYNNSPASLRFIMIDPKRVELTLYNKTPHLLTPVITEAKKSILALKWAIKEMERRYDILETESVRDIGSYHKNIAAPAYERFAKKQVNEAKNLALPERMPYIVIVIDELADIMSTYPRELEASIVRLAQMSRAVGIHLILSTQRPSVNVITGLIKANIPVRMAFQVASQIDSRTILDVGGAETLLGAGDMLYISGEMSKPVRLQSAFISETEIKKVAHFLSSNDAQLSSDILFSEGIREGADPLWSSLEENGGDSENDDELFDEARETVVRTARASTTFLQRKFRIGYARAARLMDLLEERGIVGPADGAKPRDVLIKEERGAYYDNRQDVAGEEGEISDEEKPLPDTI